MRHLNSIHSAIRRGIDRRVGGGLDRGVSRGFGSSIGLGSCFGFGRRVRGSSGGGTGNLAEVPRNQTFIFTPWGVVPEIRNPENYNIYLSASYNHQREIGRQDDLRSADVHQPEHGRDDPVAG